MNSNELSLMIRNFLLSIETERLVYINKLQVDECGNMDRDIQQYENQIGVMKSHIDQLKHDIERSHIHRANDEIKYKKQIEDLTNSIEKEKSKLKSEYEDKLERTMKTLQDKMMADIKNESDCIKKEERERYEKKLSQYVSENSTRPSNINTSATDINKYSSQTKPSNLSSSYKSLLKASRMRSIDNKSLDNKDTISNKDSSVENSQVFLQPPYSQPTINNRYKSTVC